MGGTLEFIQSFNNPKIIDASDSSLKKGKLHCGWKLFTALMMSLIMSQTHFMQVLVFLLMSSTISMPFHLCIHPLQGLATPPDHLLRPILNNLGPKSP